ncbi:unnamed protein product [Linum tenue]|uniref:Uncharacterized protein n=1 Tax=Linum tenue TaxID=586396 RepID=A0AAV0P0I5_9ROSI|nr:unnamed protein product [Linum tenue]
MVQLMKVTAVEKRSGSTNGDYERRLAETIKGPTIEQGDNKADDRRSTK